MSRKLFAFLLSELKTVRLICKNPKCGGVTELTVERLGTKFFDKAECPLCRAEFFGDRQVLNPLLQLARTVQEIQKRSAVVEVEFVLPADPAG